MSFPSSFFSETIVFQARMDTLCIFIPSCHPHKLVLFGYLRRLHWSLFSAQGNGNMISSQWTSRPSVICFEGWMEWRLQWKLRKHRLSLLSYSNSCWIVCNGKKSPEGSFPSFEKKFSEICDVSCVQITKKIIHPLHHSSNCRQHN